MGKIADCRMQIAGAVVVALALAGCGSSAAPSQETGTSEVGTKPLAVASPDFRGGGAIPARFTRTGAGAPPALSSAGGPPRAPEGATVGGEPAPPPRTLFPRTALG